MSKLQDIIQDYLPVRSYSGRGMYGKECLGVEVRSLGAFLEVLIEGCTELEHSEIRDLAEEVRGMETDSMGRDIIVYFPKVPYVGEYEDESDSLE